MSFLWMLAASEPGLTLLLFFALETLSGATFFPFQIGAGQLLLLASGNSCCVSLGKYAGGAFMLGEADVSFWLCGFRKCFNMEQRGHGG